MPLLEGNEVSKHFGGVLALDRVSFSIEKGSIVGLIGPNGAGKTTLFNAVAGAFRPSSGRILFEGVEISKLSADNICRNGIARTFQVPRPFPEMTCIENVAVGIVNRRPGCPAEQWRAMASETLQIVGLSDFGEVEARCLNVIQKKRLEIARALSTEPKLLMLDEVLGGLNTPEIHQAVELIRGLRDRLSLTIFWIEHVMGAIMKAAEKVIVLDQGKILMEGPPRAVVSDERVIQAYLGD